RALEVVAQPVGVAAREDDEVAGTKLDRLAGRAYLEPAAATRDEVEGGELAGLDAETPGSRQDRTAVQRARDADVAKERIDGIASRGVREPVGHRRRRRVAERLLARAARAR